MQQHLTGVGDFSPSHPCVALADEYIQMDLKQREAYPSCMEQDGC